MNYLVIYPGRFHPFHRGHRASYDYLTKKYGQDNVYIATTGVQAPVTSPFTFADKVQMISTLGIPAGHVVKVSNPYQSREITDSIPSEEKANTVLIFALSAKDAERFNFAPKRDGTPSYLQPMPKNLKQLKPMTKHAYVEIVPTVNFKVRGRDANSASQIREFYIKGNNNDRDQIIADLYGEAYPELRDIFDDRLGVSEQVQKIVREARSIMSARSIALLESILITERRALNEFTQGMAEAATDDPKFQKMIGAIQKTTPDPVSGYVAVSYASEKLSKKIRGAIVNGRALPATTDNPGQLIKDLKFTPDRIEQQLTVIGQKYGWDLVDPGQGQGYTDVYFDTNKEFNTHNQKQLAAMIVKTVAAINKYFSDMNRSLQATGLPVYQVNVWQGLGANGNINQIDDINQITNIAQGKDAKADPGPAIGHIILKYIPGYEAENDELGYDLEDFANAKKVASIYIAKGEQAGLQAQHRLDDHVSNMIDELLSDHGGSGLRTVRDLDEGVAEGESPADTLYFFDIGRGGRSFTNVDLRAMGLQQSQSGKWYYRPGANSTPELLKSTLEQLTNKLNVPPKPWQRPQTNEGIRDVLNFGIKKPAVKPAAPMDDFTAKMIANKQKNLKIVHPKDIYKSPDEYTRATGNKIKESADYLEEK